jgi:hypothetical protein
MDFVPGMQDVKDRAMFRSSTGSDAAASLTSIPTPALTSKRTASS